MKRDGNVEMRDENEGVRRGEEKLREKRRNKEM